jgi:hypothetical protein
MKSLNDNLRQEFSEILNTKNFNDEINIKNLDINIINEAFETLLGNKSKSENAEKGRTEFENYIINIIKSKRQENDN